MLFTTIATSLLKKTIWLASAEQPMSHDVNVNVFSEIPADSAGYFLFSRFSHHTGQDHNVHNWFSTVYPSNLTNYHYLLYLTIRTFMIFLVVLLLST